MTLAIHVTGDFICPWCFIGERRLAFALARVPDDIGYNVVWHPYELNPEMPQEGLNREFYRSRKFGSWARSLELDQHTVDAGAPDGIVFNYGSIALTPNTFLAHVATAYAGLYGLQSEFVSAVLRGYFVEGRNIGNINVLSDIALEVGIERENMHRSLLSGEADQAVRAEENAATQAGIRGVPYFTIGTTVISGAQSTEVLLAAILAEVGRVAA